MHPSLPRRERIRYWMALAAGMPFAVAAGLIAGMTQPWGILVMAGVLAALIAVKERRERCVDRYGNCGGDGRPSLHQ